MKLVDSEFEHQTDDDGETAERPSPPRPERRRVHVSLLVTLSVLVATVVLVYTLFPKRDNELLEAVIEAQLEPGEAALTAPSQPELDAWTVGTLGRSVPWPEIEAEVIDARTRVVLRRRVAIVRYRIGGDTISLAATEARSSPPRTHRRTRDGVYAVSWRRKQWTFVAVGPSASVERWAPVLGAPK